MSPMNRSRHRLPHVLVEPLEERRLMSTGTLTSLALSSNQVTMGQDVTFTATVTNSTGSSAPLGSVEFLRNSAVLATLPVNASGQAVFDDYSIYKGTHSFTAEFVGTNGFANSLSPSQTLVVTRGPVQTTSDGLKIETIGSPTGSTLTADGDFLTVNYTGWLKSNGSEFESSLNADSTPLYFQLGQGNVIQGWDEGLIGLTDGQTLVLVIPAALAYGSQSPGPSIPANSDLIFVVNVISFQSPPLGVSGNNGQPIASSAPPTQSSGTEFGATSVGSASDTLTLYLTEGLTSYWTLPGTITIAGTGSAQFTLGTITQVSGPNESDQTAPAIYSVTVTFNPTSAGTFHAHLVIPSNDPTLPVYKVKLTGEGV